MDGIDVRSYNLIVLQVLWGTGAGQMCLVQTDSPSLALQPEDALVQYGNISKIKRQGSYYITSTEEESPYSLVISGANTPNYTEPYKTPLFNSDGTVQQKDGKYLYTYIKPVKVRLGKLDGQWDNFYLDENGESKIKGWGLYGQDVFLTGEFHLNNGMSVVDFTKEGILLNFKNAGLEIKEISPGNNGIVLKGEQIQINTTDSQGNIIQTALFTDGYISADFIKAFKLESKEKINGISAWALNEDGSGHLAGNNINWDTNGNVSFTGKINAKEGEIAGITINSGHLGTNNIYNNLSLYLSSNVLWFKQIFTNKSQIRYNDDRIYQYKEIRMGTFAHHAFQESHLLRLDDIEKTFLSKSGLVIDIRNSGNYDRAIAILGGSISGLRLSTYTIQQNNETLDKLYNYIIFKDNEDWKVYLPNVEHCDIGLTFIISSVQSEENNSNLRVHCDNSKYTKFNNPLLNDDVDTTQYDTIIQILPYVTPQNNRVDYVQMPRMKNFIDLKQGNVVMLTLSNLSINNKKVWVAKYL